MDKFQPTAFPELNAVLLELIAGLQADLDKDFLGAYRRVPVPLAITTSTAMLISPSSPRGSCQAVKSMPCS